MPSGVNDWRRSANRCAMSALSVTKRASMRWVDPGSERRRARSNGAPSPPRERRSTAALKANGVTVVSKFAILAIIARTASLRRAASAAAAACVESASAAASTALAPLTSRATLNVAGECRGGMNAQRPSINSDGKLKTDSVGRIVPRNTCAAVSEIRGDALSTLVSENPSDALTWDRRSIRLSVYDAPRPFSACARDLDPAAGLHDPAHLGHRHGQLSHRTAVSYSFRFHWAPPDGYA